MIVYNYNKEGLYLGQSEARPNPLEKGKFLIPARATTETPPKCKSTEEIYFTNKWNVRVKKTSPPSKYHKWTDKIGWEISALDQTKLDQDIAKEQEEKILLDLATANEAKIQAEIKRIAIENLKSKGELPQDYKSEI